MATEKRLTEKHYNGKGYYMKCSGLCHFDGHCANCDELVKIVDRLGEYEDKAKQTVDAVEVVHGRWVIEKRHTVSSNPYMDDNYHAHATCSECDFCIDSSNGSFGFPKLNTTNYCPNCGAKMDGERK